MGASVSCSPEPDAGDKETQGRSRPDSASVVVARLAEKHGANADWLESPTPIGRFTAQYQQRLEGAPHPVVAVARLADVVRTDTSFVAIFEPTFFGRSRLYWHLTSSEDLAERLMEMIAGQWVTFFQDDIQDDIVLVATIDRIRRPAFGVTVESLSEYEADLTIESSDVLVAHGTLIDFDVTLGEFSGILYELQP